MRRVVSRVVRGLRAAVLVASGPILAQAPVHSSTTDSAASREVRGRVIDGTRNDRAVAGAIVVLHRIAPTGAGPLDSARTTGSGSFKLSYRRAGEALYLLSVRYAGIAYFSAPLKADEQAPSEPIDIVVYDTSSTGRSVAMRGRHFIVSQPDANGQRAVVEVFDLANDSTVTFVSASASAPVWSIHLPPNAISPRVGDGEFAKDAVTFQESQARLFAPLPPGLKQLIVSYELPAAAFPLAVPVERPSGLLEVLVEELAGRVQGASLQAQQSVTVGGRRFLRSVAQNVDSNAVVTIALPPVSVRKSVTNVWVLFPVLLVVALGIWGVAVRGRVTPLGARRSPASPSADPGKAAPDRTPGVVPPTIDREALVARIATLDGLLEDSSLSPASRTYYAAERAQAMARLRSVLAEYT